MKIYLQAIYFSSTFAPTNYGLWCNGNTTDFGSVVQGSSPCRPTKKPDKNRAFLLQYVWCYILKVTTGLKAWFTKSSLILPLKKWAIPFLPCVPIPIKSALILLAKFKIPFSTLASLKI